MKYTKPQMAVLSSYLKPLGFWKSVLYFGIPMILMRGMFYIVMRVLDMLGFRLFFTFLIGFGVPSALLLLISWFLWKREKSGLSFRERFRLQSLELKVLILTFLLTLIWILAPLLAAPVSQWIEANWFPANKLWIRMITPDPNYFMEIQTAGNLWIYPAVGVFILLNVFGGELFFRGYVFPRQELAFGKYTWLYHALFWTLFRSFLPWELAAILIVALAISIVVQITQNTWSSIIAHTVFLTAAFARLF